MSKANVLLPEQEGVTVWVVEHTLAAKLVTDGPHALNCFHKVAGLSETIQVKWELGKLQWLSCWNCNRKKKTRWFIL